MIPDRKMASNRIGSVGFQSLNKISNTSIDSMHEIAIDHSNNRPATLPVESPFGAPATNEEMNNDLNQNLAKQSPMDAIKEWSVSTYKCTRQRVNEKLGKSPRTVDLELEGEIERLRETQRKYGLILKLSKDLTNQYVTLVQQQNSIYECFNELTVRENKSPMNDPNEAGQNTLNLSGDFRQNSEMMRNVAKNGEKLIVALRFFTSNLSTLVNKTIEDTMITIRNYEAARLEYDAEKNSLATFLPPHQPPNVPVTSDKVNAAKCKYERLRDDVQIKMRFLEENKAKVMHKQLILFHNAFSAYASGNATALDSTLKQFSIKAIQTSFLEK